jgi:hypothetical protein
MGDYSNTPPTFLTGELPDSTKFDNITAFMNAMTGAWSTYTPAWTATSTQPVLNNGTLTGSYIRIGKFVTVRIVLTPGTTSTFGTGSYRLSLPYAPVVGSHLTAICFDSSAGSIGWAGVARLFANSATGDNMRIVVLDGTAGVSNLIPFTWATGDQLQLCGTYETTD